MAVPDLPCPGDTGVNRIEHRVYYGETDSMGWVYYGNYPAWFERGRTELLRQCGFPYVQMEADGYFLPARRCDIRYHKPARYDDLVQIITGVEALRRASVTFATAVYSMAEELLVEGHVELVCVDADTRPQPFPDEIRAALQAIVPEASA